MDITQEVLNRIALRLGTEIVQRTIAEAERDAARQEGTELLAKMGEKNKDGS